MPRGSVIQRPTPHQVRGLQSTSGRHGRVLRVAKVFFILILPLRGAGGFIIRGAANLLRSLDVLTRRWKGRRARLVALDAVKTDAVDEVRMKLGAHYQSCATILKVTTIQRVWLCRAASCGWARTPRF